MSEQMNIFEKLVAAVFIFVLCLAYPGFARWLIRGEDPEEGDHAQYAS